MMNQVQDCIKIISAVFLFLNTSKNVQSLHLFSSNIPHASLPPGSYTSYMLAPVCKPALPIQSPKTTAEVLAIVNAAILDNIPIKAFGNRHSLTDIICTDGVGIDMSEFKETMHMNPDNTVTVSAGVTLRELGAFLHSRGRSLQGGPVYGGITIGGALGTGAHGSSLKYETSISAQTIAVKIIDGHGAIRKITSRDQMRAFRVHLGLLGIILEARIQTVPDFKVTCHNFEMPDGILTNGKLEKMAQFYDFITFYWFPSRKRVVVSTSTIINMTAPGEAWSNEIPATTHAYNAAVKFGLSTFQALNSFHGLSLIEEITQSSYTQRQIGLPPFFTEDGVEFKNPATGYRYLMQDSVCGSACPWMHHPNNLAFMDNELALDIRNTSQIVHTIKDILSKSEATFQFKGIWLRFSKSSDLLLDGSYGRDTLHVEWDVVKRDDMYETASHGITAFQVMMQALVFTFGGRSHWGKSGIFYHSRDMIQKKLNAGAQAAFIAQMNEVDPNQIFLNDFGKRLLNITDKVNYDPKTTHCALQDNCVCRVNSDCVNTQTCGIIDGYPNFRACKNVELIPLLISTIVKPFQFQQGT